MSFERVRVGDVLELDRTPVSPHASQEYVTIGVRSFGKGIFHYDERPGDQLGKLRFFEVKPERLIVSNIKGWEGAIAVSSEKDAGCVASNRFLAYRPVGHHIDVNWARWFFLSEVGLPLIQRASPGSADRNRTLAIERFENLEIPLPPIDEQRRVASNLGRFEVAGGRLDPLRSKATRLAENLPLAVGRHLADSSDCSLVQLRDVLDHVREPVDIDPAAEYVTIGIRSFGRGIFHYPTRFGSEIGKLRFFSVRPGLLAISNIKAWEGAIATTSDADEVAVASNRFLFFRPRAGEDAVHFFWSLLLGSEGLAAVGQASPGSADRNRTLGLERFLDISLPLPEFAAQAEIGRRVGAMRERVAARAVLAKEVGLRIDALRFAAQNQAFAGLAD
jgi:type I restriction enzyme, S subunit